MRKFYIITITTMILENFAVSGYKNFTQSIEFGPLGRINVIHGPNNVGKSNLLQAIDLYFKLLSQYQRLKIIKKFDDFQALHYPVEEIFNLVEPQPINIAGTFYAPDESSSQQRSNSSVKIYLQLMMKVDHIEVKISSNPPNWTQNLVDELTKIYRHSKQTTHNRFMLLTINREAYRGGQSTRHIVPQQLRDALFDAKESPDAFWVQRWHLFVETMAEFEDVLGPGRFNTAFDRARNQADLVLDRGDVRISIDLLGSGMQQIVALLGQLLLTPAVMVGIEEPELNLRYTLQKRLLKALQTITQSDYGPQQLFLTSHSPAFEAEETFFAMELKEGRPTLSRRPKSLASVYTGIGQGAEDQLAEMYDKLPEPVNYVSSEGLVLLPDKVLEPLNLQQGGGLTFIRNKKTDRFELWTTAELDELLSQETSHDDESH